MALNIKDAHRRESIYSPAGNISRQYYFWCSSCGTEISSQHGYAKFHSGKCRSCAQKKRPFQAAYNNLVKNRHNIRVNVALTYEQFFELCQIPDCHYCGQFLGRSDKKDAEKYRAYLLDRRDNNVGYTFENCVPCCWPCNQSKGNRYTYEEFLTITRALSDLRKEQQTPHWREEFMWTDGDDSPNPYGY